MKTTQLCLCVMSFRLSFVLILIGLLISCSTAPNFERDNVNDPGSKAFGPDVGNLIITIDFSKNVLLEWNDMSDFDDGFIIQKSYNDSTSFFNLDTLSANSTSYTDSTKKLASDTFYRIRSFSQESDSLGSTEILKLDFAPLKSISAPDVPGNEVSAYWEPNSSGYADSYLMEKRIENNNWVSLDTLDKSVKSFTFTETANLFNIDFRITPLILDFKGVLSRVNSYSVEGIAINFPKILTINQINEANIESRWENGSLYDYSYIVYTQVVENRCCDLPPKTEWQPIDTVSTLSSKAFVPRLFPIRNFRTFSVAAFNTEGILSRKSSPFKLTFNAPFIKTPTFVPISDSKIKLKWQANNPELAIEYKILISKYGSNYKQYAKVEANVTELIIENLDSTKTYYIKVSSYRSESKYLYIDGF